MQLAKCKMCKRPFQSYGNPFCPSCMQELDEQYKPVRDYLYDHPNASIEKVVEDTGVAERIILYYLKEGRLRMANASGLLRCEQCGAAIESGRLCDKCKGKLDSRMVQPMQARADEQRRKAREAEMMPNRSTDRMHIHRDR